MDSKLKQILDNRPSVLRNSFIVLLVWIPFSIATLVFAIGGFSSLFGAELQKTFVLDRMVSENIITKDFSDQLYENSWLLGVVLLLLGALSFLVVWLCRRLMQRNLFLIELENWKFEQEEKDKDTKK